MGAALRLSMVFNAGGEVGVVEGGVDGEGLLGVLAGEFAEPVSTVFVAVDERGPVGLHAGGDGQAVEGVGVFGLRWSAAFARRLA
jgi:hypothetical protein